MFNIIPTQEEVITLIGESLYKIWRSLCENIESLYEMEGLWNHGGKAWDLEYKYRRGGKTLCAFYMKKDDVGLMVIYGKAEREKFELQRDEFHLDIQKVYDEAKTFHDGKWMMFDIRDISLFDDLPKLLRIKRKPNQK